MSLPSRYRSPLSAAICAAMLAACGGGGGGGTAPPPVPVPVAPALTMQPGSQTGLAGASVTFSVSSSGDAPLSYQWTRNGIDVAGATAASYTLPAVQPADSASVWRVAVRNAAGSVVSQPALLTVGGVGMRPLAGMLDEKTDTAGQHTFTLAVGVTGDGKGGFYVPNREAIYRVSAAGQVSTAASVSGCLFYQGALDKGGNLFIPCQTAIYKLAQDGTISLAAGTREASGYADGDAASARFNSITSLAFDSKGSLYINDRYYSPLVRKMAPDGRVTTVAGNALSEVAGALDGTGSAARFIELKGMAFDAQDLLYVLDGHAVRTVTAAGVVGTAYGKAGELGAADGTAATARFRNPWGIAIDAAGNIFLADTDNNAIRKITAAGQVSTLAGRHEQAGSADGAGGLAAFAAPFALTLGGDGNLYVADAANETLRKVTMGGVVSTFAGAPLRPRSSGSITGLGQEARFYDPRGMAVDGAGNVLVADFGNRALRKITPGAEVTTVAGSPGNNSYSDGQGILAGFQGPDDLAIDGAGNVYAMDRGGRNNESRLRKMSASGAVSTVAMPSDPVNVLYPNGGQEIAAVPTAVAADAAGNIYVSVSASGFSSCTPHTTCSFILRTAVRRIAPDGKVVTLAASPHAANPATLPSSMGAAPPQAMAVDASGNVYLSDTGMHRILKIAANGAVSTFAGGVQGAADGQGGAAGFSSPTKLAVDAAGNVYVLDSGNFTVRKITPSGAVSTVAGTAGKNVLALGPLPGSLATMGGIAVDAGGNLFVSLSNGVVRIAKP